MGAVWAATPATERSTARQDALLGYWIAYAVCAMVDVWLCFSVDDKWGTRGNWLWLALTSTLIPVPAAICAAVFSLIAPRRDGHAEALEEIKGLLFGAFLGTLAGVPFTGLLWMLMF